MGRLNMSSTSVKALLLDIGGVILTKGWGRESRQLAAEKFRLDYEDLRERHELVFHLYEEGRLTLHQYLKRIVFHTRRSFSYQEFIDFMFQQSRPHPEMLDLVRNLKGRHKLKVVALSNEGRELTEHRIRLFDLTSLIDFFVCSCFVGTLKPDPAIFSFAMDQVQLDKSKVVYIDDTHLHVEVARELGIPSICHASMQETKAGLEQYGLTLDD